METKICNELIQIQENSWHKICNVGLKEELDNIVQEVIGKTKKRIQESVTKKLGIVKSDLAGTDEDVDLSGELEEYKEGFACALDWLLNNLN